MGGLTAVQGASDKYHHSSVTWQNQMGGLLIHSGCAHPFPSDPLCLFFFAAMILLLILLSCIHCCWFGKPKYQGSRVQPLHPVWWGGRKQHPLMLKWGPFPHRTVKLTEGVIKVGRRRKRAYFHFIFQCWDKDWANMQPCCWNPWGPAEWRHVIKIHHRVGQQSSVSLPFHQKEKHQHTHNGATRTQKESPCVFECDSDCLLKPSCLVCPWHLWKMWKMVIRCIDIPTWVTSCSLVLLLLLFFFSRNVVWYKRAHSAGQVGEFIFFGNWCQCKISAVNF